MAFEFTDALSEVKTLISSNWTKANTDSIEPTFEYVYDKKVYTHYDGQDVVFFQEIGQNQELSSLGNTARDRFYRIRIDIRSNYEGRADDAGRSHLVKMKKETERIINTNAPYEFTNGQGIIVITNQTDLTNGMKKLWRVVYELEVRKYNEVLA